MQDEDIGFTVTYFKQKNKDKDQEGREVHQFKLRQKGTKFTKF